MTGESEELHEVNIEAFISYGHITRYKKDCMQFEKTNRHRVSYHGI